MIYEVTDAGSNFTVFSTRLYDDAVRHAHTRLNSDVYERPEGSHWTTRKRVASFRKGRRN